MRYHSFSGSITLLSAVEYLGRRTVSDLLLADNWQDTMHRVVRQAWRAHDMVCQDAMAHRALCALMQAGHAATEQVYFAAF